MGVSNLSYPITGDEPYFNDPNGFKQLGIFVPIIPYVVQAINARTKENIQKFEADVGALLTALNKDPAAEKTMYQLLEFVRAKGLVVMSKRKADGIQYHTAEHAAEASHDTGSAMAAEMKNNFNKESDKKINQFFIELAKAAVAWHDVVQHKTPPHNEEQSAIEFAKEMDINLNEFKKLFPAMSEQINNFAKHLEFISRELIVYNTWLVFGMEHDSGLTAKSLRVHIDNISASLGIDQSHFGPYMKRLYIASRVISISDVSRCQFEHVTQEQLLLHGYNALPDKIKNSVEEFFKIANIKSAEDKEIFFGLFGTHTRMFSEINLPQLKGIRKHHKASNMNITDISQESYDHFNSVLNTLRSSDDPASLDLDYSNLFRMLMNTKSLKNNDTSVKREQAFAHAQHHQMWEKYAEQLEMLTTFMNTLNEEQLDHLGHCLFILSTHFQPGSEYLKNDQTYQTILNSLSMPATFAIANKS